MQRTLRCSMPQVNINHECQHKPIRYIPEEINNVFHHSPAHTSHPSTPKTCQKSEKLHLDILTTAQ